MSTTEKSFSNGEIIIKEGASGNTFFQLLEGKVAVYKNYGKADQVQLAILEAGQYYGEMAVIEKTYPRSTTIVAEGDVKVIEIAAEELNDYITQHPDKILAIMKLLGSRIQAMTADYNEAKKTLDDVRKADSKNKYDGFFSSMINRSIYVTAKNFRLERPSIEALRAASEIVSSQGSDGDVYNYGTIIFKEGDIGKCMYIVHSGKVGIYNNYGAANEFKASDVEPVACFGEMEMLMEEPRTTTAIVEVSDTKIELIRPEDLENLFKTAPAKIDMILKNLSYRLRLITYEYFKACQEIYESTAKDDD